MNRINSFLKYILALTMPFVWLSCIGQDLRKHHEDVLRTQQYFDCRNVTELALYGASDLYTITNKQDICKITEFLNQKWNNAAIYDWEKVWKVAQVKEAKGKRSRYYFHDEDIPSFHAYDRREAGLWNYFIERDDHNTGFTMVRSHKNELSGSFEPYQVDGEKFLSYADVCELSQFIDSVRNKQGLKPKFYDFRRGLYR